MQNLIAIAKKVVKKGYKMAIRSIAFYPVFISLVLFGLATLTLFLEDLNFVKNLKESHSYLFIKDVDTARTILSTLIAGILSLTVFSFTMVMVVLNQASSNFSPRLLPGLISNKRHQLVLGCYIGTLLYCTFVLISLGTYEPNHETVGLSTTIGAFLGIFCVGLFVSFIHNISSAIQIRNIINGVYSQTNHKLDGYLNDPSPDETPLQQFGDGDFFDVSSEKGGYFQGFDADLVDNDLLKEDLQLVVIPYVGQHIWQGNAVFRTNRPLSREEAKALLFACAISKDLHDGSEALFGMIKLMEIAVRAMSLAINDPGTALDVVYKLGPLLAKSVRLPSYTSENPIGKKMVIVRTNISTSKLLETIVQPIRLYAKTDNMVILGLLSTLRYIEGINGITEDDKKAIAYEKAAFKDDIEKNIINKIDKKRVFQAFDFLDTRLNVK